MFFNVLVPVQVTEIDTFVDSLDDDTVLVCVDCHI